MSDLSAASKRWLAQAGAPAWIKRELSAMRHETAGHRWRRNAAEAVAHDPRHDVARLKVELAEAKGDRP